MDASLETVPRAQALVVEHHVDRRVLEKMVRDAPCSFELQGEGRVEDRFDLLLREVRERDEVTAPQGECLHGSTSSRRVACGAHSCVSGVCHSMRSTLSAVAGVASSASGSLSARRKLTSPQLSAKSMNVSMARGRDGRPLQKGGR